MLDALRFGFEERPRLVHRLDKDTSGLLLIARTGQAAKRLGESFRDRETEKLYWAVVVGAPPKAEGAIDLPLAKRPGVRGDRELVQVDHEEGQKALTHFQVLDRAGKRAALLALWPRTGRTHQLRVHCAEIGCPILGDAKYGGEEALLSSVADAGHLHLHARRLALAHPSGTGELRVEAEAPPHFRRTVKAFGFSLAGD
jgi:23S rRNA pseudouridine955/2504/2580 synthase